MISITAAVLPLIVLLSFNATGSEMTSAVSDIPARIGFMNIIEDVVIRHADEQKAIFPSHYSVYLGLIERIPPHREPLLAWPYRGQFKETIAFAKPGQPHIIPPAQGADIKEEITKDEIEVGDLIRAEIGGVLVPEKPVRVRAIQEHEGCPWVFVDGHEAGILMENAILEQKGNGEDDP
jgi:hypothetical protein